MKTNNLQNLAIEVVADGGMKSPSMERVFSILSRSQLKTFVSYLKQELKHETLTVVSAVPLSASESRLLLTKFGRKFFVNTVDPTLGAGLVILDNDDIIDLSVRGEIRRFIRAIS